MKAVFYITVVNVKPSINRLYVVIVPFVIRIGDLHLLLSGLRRVAT